MARPPVTATNGHTAAPADPLAAAAAPSSRLAAVVAGRRHQILGRWVEDQLQSSAFGFGHVSDADVRAESAAVLDALHRALAAGGFGAGSAEYTGLVRLLNRLSSDRAHQGYSPSETAVAIFSLKDAINAALTDAHGDEPAVLAAEILAANRLVDDLGLVTFEAYVAGREEVVNSQHQSLLELSTPVVKLWDGILAVPLIGTLDSGRTQLVMENLLQAIVDTGSQVAIVDITGVSVVDTLVAQHLLKTVAATRLMGADCVISGIRPQIAQTMVHLGVDLNEVVTKATLADAFRFALGRLGSGPAATPGR